MPSQRLFRSSDQHLRVSDADRQAVADELAKHYGEGRLDKAEFDERVSQAMSAKTRGDLNGLFDDLPDLTAPAGAGGLAGRVGRPGRARRADRSAERAVERRERAGSARQIGMLILVVIVATATWHALALTFIPWLWIAILAVVVLIATGHIRRPRP
jgi:hypothetical protein